MGNTSCASTGHRPHKFPWKYDESDSRCVALKAALSRQISTLIEAGGTDFYTGCANGVDCWAALSILALREKNPALKLHNAIRFLFEGYLQFVYKYQDKHC